ncbi:hypothetical protein BKA70DRAFT_170871 [Coprinopsis sp. MPI-PUGE-AT-0042]|nr:hypothetical protein BKA70DRAFT_170871 [Coprinopsis sp. MPI-PUGE-AT-0042]
MQGTRRCSGFSLAIFIASRLVRELRAFRWLPLRRFFGFPGDISRLNTLIPVFEGLTPDVDRGGRPSLLTWPSMGALGC